MQSMLFIKASGKPGQAWHQDEFFYMSAESLLPWFGLEPGTPVASADYRDIVLVAGRDPYAWKGTENRAGPHVRPSGRAAAATPSATLRLWRTMTTIKYRLSQLRPAVRRSTIDGRSIVDCRSSVQLGSHLR